MFESAELGHKIDKETFAKEAPPLRQALLAAQMDLLRSRKFSVVVLLGGVDGAGKGETVNLLTEWMDPRHIQVHAMGAPSDEESARPLMWRFWRALPPKGKLGIFFGSWYTATIVRRVYGESRDAELDHAMDECIRFERMLTDEGMLVLKYWMHLSKKKQKKRLRALEADPATRWRVTEQDWKHFALYDKFRRISERALRQSSTAEAPWLVVEGADAEYRGLTVARSLLDAIRGRLDARAPREKPVHAPAIAKPVDNLYILRTLTQKSLAKERYQKDLEKWQGRLNLLSRSKKFARRAVIAVFEGPDAGGKGGAIRRVTQALDARSYTVVPVAAPSDEERAQPYLWRFWRHIPGHGRLTIFDRSWYGRVLVERVEGFCQPADWMRAYQEINDFEEQLAEHGIVVVKFWLATTKDEQLRRFRERERTPWKKFKITEEDWRNRKKWEAYERAACDMIDRTSTEIAPWTLVEANDKYHARIKVLRTIAERIEDAF